MSVEVNIDRIFVRLEHWFRNLNEPGFMKSYDLENKDLETLLNKVINSNDPAMIIAAERTILLNELDRFGNGIEMEKSYESALRDLNLIQYRFSQVYNAEEYARIAENHSHPRNQRNGLPYDEVRQSLASHNTRLQNMSRTRGLPSDMEVLTVRQSMWKKLNDLYKNEQRSTLQSLNWNSDPFRYEPSKTITKFDGKSYSELTRNEEPDGQRWVAPNPQALKRFLDNHKENKTDDKQSLDSGSVKTNKYRPG